MTSHFQRFCSAYFVYMRNSSAAKRPASSPPAPARISTKTFLSSLGSRGTSIPRSSSSSFAWRAPSSSISAWARSRISRSASSARMWRASEVRASTLLYSSNLATVSARSAAALAVRA